MSEPATRQGWRSFECDECGATWSQPTRDYKSPSGEDCKRCGNWETPVECWPDPNLAVDKFGNLEAIKQEPFDQDH